MGIFRKLWALAAVIAAVDYMASPSKSVEKAFRVAASPGPRLFRRGAEGRRIPEPGSPSENERLREEGLKTLERAARANQESLQ